MTNQRIELIVDGEPSGIAGRFKHLLSAAAKLRKAGHQIALVDTVTGKVLIGS